MYPPKPHHLLVVGATLLCLVLSDSTHAQTCTTPSDAAQRLYATSLADSALHGAYSEDANFFSSTRGKPNVYFLLDNSSSMARLPPNGPSFYAGTYANWVTTQKTSSGWTFGSLPPLRDLGPCTGGANDLADPGCMYKALKDPLSTSITGSATQFLDNWSVGAASQSNNTAVMGCGDDEISEKFVIAPTSPLPANPTAVQKYGSMLYWFRNLTYQAPCDDKVVTGDNGPFTNATHTAALYDFATQANACPRYNNTAAGATGSPGFDPDYYCGTNGTTTSRTTCARTQADCGGTCCSGTTCSATVPNFFDPNSIFHDNITDDPNNTTVRSAPGVCEGGNANAPDNGWSSTAVLPTATGATVTDAATTFCNGLYGTTATQGSQTKAAICKACLVGRGFLFDGRLYRKRQENLDVDGNRSCSYALPYPSIWYTGNFLNFYPPKFLIARRVLKDLLRKQNNIRVGIKTFSGQMDPYPTCNTIESAFDPKAGIRWLNTSVTFDQGTPTPQKMLEVGQSFHKNSTPWFTTANGGQGPLASGDFASGADPAICYDCQKTSLVLMTDGLPTPGQTGITGTTTADDALSKLAGDSSTGTNDIDIVNLLGLDATSTPPATAFTNLESQKQCVVQIAWYLHNMDFRPTSDNGVDCQAKSSKQVMDVYTVGFAADALPRAGDMLQLAAKAGGGTYVNANSPKDLVSALSTVMNRVNSRATTFSVASISTLQSTAGSAVIVPRFSPVSAPEAGKPAFYPGHLFRFDLYSEFTNGCQVNTDGTVTNDIDCDGKCESVFLIDGDKDFIAEDVNGQYFKLSQRRPLCTAAKHCSACSTMTTATANPFWDSGAALMHPLPTGDDAPPAGTPDRAWTQRPVYTVVDDNHDGLINSSDTMTLLRPTDTVATALLPYLNLGGSSTICSSISTQLATLDATESAAVANSKLECAKTIIRYVLGADVFNTRVYKSDGPAGKQYPVTDQDTLADRESKLGDIFHSSPVLIDPPLPPTGILCTRGLHNQCINSLWTTSTPHDSPTGNAYGDYATTYANRSKIVLVGANDGLVHAFNGGVWHADTDNPELVASGIHTAGAPYFGYYDRGDGSELWSFLPPDMLSKAGQLLLSSVPHPIFADGTPMVRDVWADGSTNLPDGSGALAADDKKQAQEFHTVAVIGERRGGTHFFALDVTNASYPVENSAHFQAPKFLWMYPQPNSAESFDFGETYAEFLPTPPPIGPVRIKADTALAGTQKVNNVDFHEEWIVFLNGGFDPAYQRGRGVHMVDVWTGAEVFDFSKPAGATFSDATDPRWALDYPVAAPVAMVMWGSDPYRTATNANGGFFDTATFGDTGGQLWTIRFSDPGDTHGGTKTVDNWFGGRVLQMGGVSSTRGLTNNLPFFYVTANVALGDNGAYRVLAGTGDRYNLLDKYGGNCKVENVRACLQNGCKLNNVASPPATLSVSAGGLGGSSYTTTVTSTGITRTDATTSAASATGCADSASVNLAVSGCSTTVLKSSGPSLNGSVSCSNDASLVYGCTPTSIAHPDPALSDYQTGQSNAGAIHNWFYSLRVFDNTGSRTIFNTLAQAIRYDGARYHVTDGGTPSASSGVTLIDGTSSSPATSSSTDPGYAIKLTHSANVTLAPKTYHVNQYDERTSSPTAIVSQCAFWNTTQRSLSEDNDNGTCTVSGLPTPLTPFCTASNRNINYFYGADAATGALCGLYSGSSLVRSVTSATLVPPPAPQFTVFVNAKGQAAFGLTAVQSESGATNIGQGGVSDAASLLEFLNVDRGMHACRHSGSCN